MIQANYWWDRMHCSPVRNQNVAHPAYAAVPPWWLPSADTDSRLVGCQSPSRKCY